MSNAGQATSTSSSPEGESAFISAERLSSQFPEKECSRIRQNIIKLTDWFKDMRVVPTCGEFFKQSEILGLDLVSKASKDQSKIKELVKNAIEDLKIHCFRTRTECIDFKSDTWRYYCQKDTRIHCRNFDFGLLRSESLKKELKIIFQQLILHEQINNDTKSLITCCESLEKMFNVTSFKDITSSKLQVLFHQMLFTKGLKPSTVSKINSCFIKAFDILIKETPSLGLDNAARDIQFHNLKSHSGRTRIIPEKTLREITDHLDELPENVSLIFKLSLATGWRFGEVAGLRPEDFRKVEGYPDLIEVEAFSSKTASSRKEAGYTLRPCDFIPVQLYSQLKGYLEKTRKERAFYKIETCFYIVENGRAYPISNSYYNHSINELIKKNNITGEDGNLWHFNSRQTRKKVAITLIQKRVPLNVVQQKLTHQSSKTTQTYYTESQEINLLEINEEYFSKIIQGHLETGKPDFCESGLEEFYESEKTVKLEKGLCAQPLCPRIKEAGCVGCTKFCTGRVYLDKLKEMHESVEKAIESLELFYGQKVAGPNIYPDTKKHQNLLQRERRLREAINELEKRDPR